MWLNTFCSWAADVNSLIQSSASVDLNFSYSSTHSSAASVSSLTSCPVFVSITWRKHYGQSRLMLQIPPEPSLIPACGQTLIVSSVAQAFPHPRESLRWVCEKVWGEYMKKFEVNLWESLRWVCNKVWGESAKKFEASPRQSLRWVCEKVWGEWVTKFEVSLQESLRWVHEKVWGESARKFEVSLGKSL